MKREKLKQGLKITVAILLAAWIFMCQFLMQDRMPDSYLQNLFAVKKIPLYTGTIKINGHNLHYAKTGRDSLPALVFIHGSPGSLNHFQKYLQDTDLLKKYQLIAIDRPGFGYSDFGNTMNLERQAVLISALFDSIVPVKTVYLAGHSLSGALIVKLAAIDTGKIKGIVIIAGSVDPSQEGSGYWRPVITYSPLRWLVPVAFRYSNEEQWWLKDDLVKLKDDFTKVKCPVHIFHGDKDENVPVENASYAKKMLVNAETVTVTIFPGADHFIVWSKYARIKEQLLAIK